MKFDEKGNSGLQEFSGFISEAYNTKLQWPSVYPLYNRIRRSDPEISIIRNVWSLLARSIRFEWELPDNANDAEKQAQEFAQQVFDDIDGGADGLAETIVSQVPFMGWAWWEVLPGVRKAGWSAPEDDGWRSEYTDGRIGIRRFAWRDQSSFYRWDFSDNGRLQGMIQRTPQMMKEVNLPLENSLHLTFGDANNPEGLSPLEAVWRLERIKYGLEIVQGIGFEHTAGYLEFEADAEASLSNDDKIELRRIARGVMTAQESNYLAMPRGWKAQIVDTPFQAAGAILDAIKYYGILKMMVYNMQWMALSAVTGSGSYSAMDTSTGMFIDYFNSMLAGFADQMDAQIGKRLFEWNSFPGMVNRPKLRFSPIQSKLTYEQINALITGFGWDKLGEDDERAIRQQTILPEGIPDMDTKPEPKSEPEQEETEPKRADMARRPFIVDDDEFPEREDKPVVITDNEVAKGIAKLKRRNKREKLGLDDFIGLLEADTYEGEDNAE